MVLAEKANMGIQARSGRAMWNLAMWIDEHWHLLARTTQRFALSHICQIMLLGRHNRSYGLWKLGDTLGDHIGTPSARRVLEQVAVEAEHPEARDSALHGLIHYAAGHPRARQAILARLRPVACQHHGEAKLAFEWAMSCIERGSSCG